MYNKLYQGERFCSDDLEHSIPRLSDFSNCLGFPGLWKSASADAYV